MKVSVIVPVYDVETYLKRCLDSLIAQSYHDYEILCVNDCSPDHSQAILERFQKKYPEKIRVLVNEKNMGLGRTRDRAVREAKGEYVLFVDSDDYVAPDYIERYLRETRGGKVDVVVGGYIKDTEGKKRQYESSKGIWSIVSYTIACAKLYRKDFILDHQLEFKSFRCGEDIFFNLNVFLCKPRYRVMDYAGYYYYTNRNSITGTMNADKNLEVMIDEMFDEILQTYPGRSQQEDQVLSYVYLTHIINTMIQYNRGCGIRRMKEKYQFCFSHLQEKFPEYRKNPLIGWKKPKGQSRKIRLAVGVVMTLHRLSLDPLFFYLLALV